MVEQATLSRNQMVNQVLKIGHGDLDVYVPIGMMAAKEDPELLAHLIAWNFIKGEVRDSKVALPVVAMRGSPDPELFENAVAHLVSLDPRELLRAIKFNSFLANGSAMEPGGKVTVIVPRSTYPITPGAGAMLKKAVVHYLRIREMNPGWWTRSALQHRKSMKALYVAAHIKPCDMAQAILFKKEKPKGSVFEALNQLKNMAPLEAAGTILNFKIPFLVLSRALRGFKNKPDVIMALIERASGNELITNTKMFQRLGIFDNPVLKATYDAAVERAQKDKRVSSLKAGQAAAALKKVGAKTAAAKVQKIQTEKLEQLGGIDGDWLVLGDRSGSMRQSIEIARQVSALIAQQVKGAVHLIFFNDEPTSYEVTGMSLEEIKALTTRIGASGATCIGCGLEKLRFNNVVVNGIVICSDGGENRRPAFAEAYKKYVETSGAEPTVYHLWVPGDRNVLGSNCEALGVPLQYFDVSAMDYYALPNLIKTLRSGRYSLADEILGTPLLKLADVFQRKEEAA